MCAIIGFIGNHRFSRPRTEIIWDAIASNLHRGPDAWGVASVRRGRLFETKRPGRITVQRSAVLRAIDCSSAIALHMRWATRGRPENNKNNHPHNFGRGSLIHNGTITWADDLAEDNEIKTATACDSEVLARLVGGGPQRSRIDRVSAALDLAQDYSEDNHQRHAAVAVWPDLIVVAKQGKPLAWLDLPEGRYFASVAPSREWNAGDRDWIFQVKIPQPKGGGAACKTGRFKRC